MRGEFRCWNLRIISFCSMIFLFAVDILRNWISIKIIESSKSLFIDRLMIIKCISKRYIIALWVLFQILLWWDIRRILWVILLRYMLVWNIFRIYDIFIKNIAFFLMNWWKFWWFVNFGYPVTLLTNFWTKFMRVILVKLLNFFHLWEYFDLYEVS